MEMVAESKMLMVYQVCDKCREGVMTYDFGSDKAWNAEFPHKCNKCGHTENYPVRYPYQKLVPIEILREPTEQEISN